MRRLLSVLLVLGGLVLVAPPAQAAVSVTVSASRTTLPTGSSVTLSGRAVDAKPGSVVKLQRHTATGWTTVASKKVWSTRSYSFTTTPPKGYQSYRVLKPRQLGQASAVSRTVKLTVQWRPTVVLGDAHDQVDGTTGQVTTTATGGTTGLAAGTQVRRDLQQPDGSWAAQGWTTLAADHTWDDTFTSSDGQHLRYTAPASGARLATSSATFAVDGSWTPTITAAATMDPATLDARVTGSSTGLPAGVTLQRQRAVNGTWTNQGTPVTVAADGSFTDSFVVEMNRDYRYAAPAAGLRQAASSAPFAFADTPVGQASLGTTTSVVFPAGATERTLLLHLDEGQVFTSDGPWWVTESVTDPAGATMPGFGPADQDVTAVAPVSGDYRIRLTAGSSTSSRTVRFTLSAPVVVTTTLDAPAQDVASTMPGQVVDLVFAAEAGGVVSEHATPDPQLGHAPGAVSLRTPGGTVVPTWGRLVREGTTWRLPGATGDYTLRITPGRGGVVDRQEQAVLAAHEATPAVDGAPGHVSLDRPGRVGVVTVTVPAGLRMRLSDTASAYLDEETFGPDGALVETGSTSPVIDPTVAGTYTQLVSYDGTAEVDYYASTPATYDVAEGSTVPFDQGPAPDREARLRIPVTSGQLFSVEVLDDSGKLCSRWLTVESGDERLDWLTRGTDHPAVVKVAGTGDLVLGVTPCTATGSFRLVPTTVVASTDTGTTTDQSGGTTTTSTATVEATAPGQVMMVEYDAGPHAPNRVTLRATGSTFPDGTTFSPAHAAPTSSSSTGIADGTWETMGTTLSNLTGPTYFFVYAGPTATGTLDLELSRLDY